jgi:hypothetical protein
VIGNVARTKIGLYTYLSHKELHDAVPVVVQGGVMKGTSFGGAGSRQFKRGLQVGVEVTPEPLGERTLL